MKGISYNTFVIASSLFIASLIPDAASVTTRGSNLWYLMKDQQQQQQQQQEDTNILRIRAVNYTSMAGVDTVEASDYVGSLDAEDWLRYDVLVPAAGTYVLELQVSSPTGEGSFVVGNAETRDQYATIPNISAAGNDNRWQAIRTTVDLPSGNVPLEIRSSQRGWNLQAFSLQPYDPARLDAPFVGTSTTSTEFSTPSLSPAPTNSSSFTPTSPSVPPFFEMIAADNFVQMQGGELQTSSEGLNNIGWLDPSDYVIYNVSLPYSGTYDLKTRISSPDGQGAFQIIHNETQEIYANITNLPRTGDWQIWQTLSNPVQLPGGALSLRIVPIQQGWNLIWFSFELLEMEQSSYPSQIPSNAPTSFASLDPTGTRTQAPVQPPSTSTTTTTTATTTSTTLQPTLSPTQPIQLAQPTRSPLGTPTWAPRDEPPPQVSRSETTPVVEETSSVITTTSQSASPTRSPLGTPTWSPREEGALVISRQDPNPDTWF